MLQSQIVTEDELLFVFQTKIILLKLIFGEENNKDFNEIWAGEKIGLLSFACQIRINKLWFLYKEIPYAQNTGIQKT